MAITPGCTTQPPAYVGQKNAVSMVTSVLPYYPWRYTSSHICCCKWPYISQSLPRPSPPPLVDHLQNTNKQTFPLLYSSITSKSWWRRTCPQHYSHEKPLLFHVCRCKWPYTRVIPGLPHLHLVDHLQYANKQTNKQTNKHTNKHTNKQTSKQTFPFLYLSTTSDQKLKKANQTLLPFLSHPLKRSGEEGKRVREGRTLIVMVVWERGGVVGFVLTIIFCCLQNSWKIWKWRRRKKRVRAHCMTCYLYCLHATVGWEIFAVKNFSPVV